ncbi:cytochrome c [Flavobacterium columnare]|uniref:Cytochrome c family protein n=2 Tax=Flavobacterium columnare TaxID=996 RepID=G8X6K0_FLACA|nr:cytochrome c [Flavobacterium columnare]AEW84892.2 cytochrome c family protein [Flavobacterium columnare ATCC 49512]AMO20169.1 cytochrome c [Flavobacterium columnare]AUX18120.1 cytochrome C [Flavobacterium columnare]MBF6651754.1 cytochrome c [Flavobacterium columnare]MBF6654267.1 cytochrome c [Flavobacterium columnare]
MRRVVYSLTAIMGLSSLLFSCKSDDKPNYQFFPNMYESVAYETYSESNAFKNGKEGQLPAQGSIKRGFVPYELPNTPAGYEASKAMKSPLDSSAANMEKGKELFDIYCISCHGEKGDGKGKLVQREKFLGVPSYKDRAITVGSVFHVETYGLNAMGSHANQLNKKERWQVAEYVMKLKSELK